MKSVVLFGTGDFSDILTYVLEEKIGARVLAYTVDGKYLPEGSAAAENNGKPLLAFENIEQCYKPADCTFVVGLIGKKMFRQREAVFGKIREKGFEISNVIDPSASVDTKELGCGNVILANTSIEHHCRIGDGNIIWQNVVLPHHNVVGNFNNLAPSVSLSGYSSIGEHCFIGNNSCIKNRIHVGDYAYIGAGSYISSPVAENTVMVPHRSYRLEGKTGFDFL